MCSWRKIINCRCFARVVMEKVVTFLSFLHNKVFFRHSLNILPPPRLLEIKSASQSYVWTSEAPKSKEKKEKKIIRIQIINLSYHELWNQKINTWIFKLHAATTVKPATSNFIKINLLPESFHSANLISFQQLKFLLISIILFLVFIVRN